MQLQITKLEREGLRSGYDWKVERLGEQKDGTYKIPKADPSTPTVSGSAPVPNQSTAIESKSITELPTRKHPQTEAEAHCRRLVDLTAETMKYAETHGGRVTRDDARAIALTVYIQAGRSGRLRWNPRRGDTRRAG